MTEPERVIRQWEDGKIGRGTFETLLCSVAATHAPATFADRVPSEFLDEIRTSVEPIPDPKDVILIFGGSLAPGTDLEAWQREREADKVRYVEGLRAWKAYFEAVGSAEPEPHLVGGEPSLTRTPPG